MGEEACLNVMESGNVSLRVIHILDLLQGAWRWETQNYDALSRKVSAAGHGSKYIAGNINTYGNTSDMHTSEDHRNILRAQL